MDKTASYDLGIITAVFIAASLVLYGYFVWFTPGGIGTVYKNWDGPAYVVVSQSLYNPTIINQVNHLQYISTPSYFSQEFPLYPFIIRVFSFMGYDVAMIFVSQLFALLFIFASYFLIKRLEPTASARTIAILLIFYLPRWFVVSHVGSSEPVFMFFLVVLWMLLMDKRIGAAAIALALAQLTRLAGAFFFVGVALYGLLWRKLRTFVPFLFVPLVACGLFWVYKLSFGSFWTEIYEYGLHPITQFPPLKNFTTPEYYYDVWKEGVLLIHLLYAIAFGLLFQRKRYVLAVTALPYYLYLFFVHHADMSRYLLPMLPLLAVAFAQALSKKEVYIPLFIFVPIIFLISVSYMQYNVAPFR